MNKKSKLNIVNITSNYLQIIKFCYTFGQIFFTLFFNLKNIGFISDDSEESPIF